jgi:hypothetical protein
VSHRNPLSATGQEAAKGRTVIPEKVTYAIGFESAGEEFRSFSHLLGRGG